MDHLTATTKLAVERYLLDELSEQERDEFEEHYFTCAECAEAVQTGTQLKVNGRAVARDQSRYPSLPGRVTEIRRRPGDARKTWLRGIEAAAAVVLLSFTGYQNLVLIPQLKSPQAVTRSFLRPQSRGVVPMVKESGSSEPLLTLELNTSSPRESYEVDLVKAGHTLYCIPDAKVTDGAVEVLLPRNFAAGTYEMLVRVPSDGSEAGRYPFEIAK